MTTKTAFTLGQRVRLKGAPHGIIMEIGKSRRERACQNCGRGIAAKELYAGNHFGAGPHLYCCLNCCEEVADGN